MSSRESIASQALSLLGANTILSFDEGTNEANIINDHYDQFIRNMFSLYPWSFATKKVTLEQYTTDPLNEYKFQAVQNTLTTIANLAQLFAGASEKEQKKAFEIQKAVGIAQATIDTYKSATAAYSSLAGIPVVGPALGIAAAAAAVTAGLLNVKQIASQEFKASGGGAAGGVGAAGVSAPTGGAGSSVISPNFNIVGNAQATNPLAGLGGQPIQAYVVSGEVTTAQSLDRNRINYATFG